MINIVEKCNCCGCTACYNACPKRAISMRADTEGFLYPEIDDDKCIKCGVCEKVCPILNPPARPMKSVSAYVTQCNKVDVLQESTSGGFMDCLGEYVISNGGVVFGVKYGNDFMPIHSLAVNTEDLKAFRNSKYSQSVLGDAFSDIKKYLEQEQKVLFIGTPCQVAGLKSYLRKEYENLISADLVCRSIPSPLLFKKYLEWQEKKYNSKINSIVCRNKTYGYHRGTLVIRFENGRVYSGSNRVDKYMKAFHTNICSRPSCYSCQFKTKTRCSDFTVFDSWRPDVVCEGLADNDQGYSNVVIHTLKGEQIIHEISGSTIWRGDQETMFRFTGEMERSSVKKPQVRDDFYIELNRHGFEDTMKKYVYVGIKDRLIEGIKPFIFTVKRFAKKACFRSRS